MIHRTSVGVLRMRLCSVVGVGSTGMDNREKVMACRPTKIWREKKDDDKC